VATMTRARAWDGPVILSRGFRPFFLFGALYAAILVTLWIAWYFGYIDVPSALPPTAWHAHELLFGYVSTIIAGFLLTAVPNWTGRLPVVGWPLAVLFSCWLFGRIVLAFSAGLPELIVALATLVFPVTLATVIGREVVMGKNWRNLKVLIVLGVFTFAQALFHYELWRSGDVTYGDRLAIATTIMLIMIVGGRIVPSFTINWMKRVNPGALPAPFGRYDKLAMGVGGAALIGWVLLPTLSDYARLVGVVLVIAGLVHSVRLMRWRPYRTFREPLVAVLHIAYLFVPVGFLIAGYAAFTDDYSAGTGAIHAWTVGAIGLMTLAMMTRTSRGHSGQPLKAPPPTVAIYLAILVAAISRIIVAFLPEFANILMPIAGLGWVLAFLGFAITYAPMLLGRRKDMA